MAIRLRRPRRAVVPPTHRIIQICDWHFVPFDDFAADLRSQGDLIDEAIDASYREFLDQVEQIQLEQMELLRELRTTI